MLPKPECIARAAMPQIDERDELELLAFLAKRGVTFDYRAFAPTELRFNQRIIPAKVHGVARHPELLDKPILVAADLAILDGNHRAAAARVLRRDLHGFWFGLPFIDMLGHLYAFPKTYEYGDGAFHPVRN
jgi:hypothetical protein